MRRKKFLAAVLALAMTITSIQLPPMQVKAEEITISGIKDHWSFDSLTSDAGSESTGVLNGNVSIVDSSSAVFGNVLRFGTGTDNFMKLENYINTGAASTSFSMWYRYDTTITEGNANASAVLLQHEGSGRSILTLKPNGQYHTYLNATDAVSDGTVRKGDWQHITVTFDQTTKKVCYYINGELDSEKDLGSNVVNAMLNLRLGAHKNEGSEDPHPMRGDVDEFYVFEKALTADEAKAVYEEKALELYKEKLAALITEAENLYENGEVDPSHALAVGLQNAITDAGTAKGKDNVTMAELTAAYEALETAMQEYQSATPIVLTVDADEVLRTIDSDSIFGINHRYAFNGYGSFDASTMTIKEDFKELYENAGFGSIRYPGGTISNLFNWKATLGPVEDRKDQIHGFYNNSGQGGIAPNFGIGEIATFADSVDSEIVYVYSLGRGNAQDAADLIEYLNAQVGTNPNGGIDWAAVRAENGHPEPYNVRYFEIGNEMNQVYSDGTSSQGYWLHGFSDPETAYIDGGTASFTNQYAVCEEDWNAEASKSDGSANMVRYMRYANTNPKMYDANNNIVDDPSFVAVNKDSVKVYVGGTQWTIVESFENSGASDQHVVVDYSTGAIKFGNGEKGAIPAANTQITVDYTVNRDGFIKISQAMKETTAAINQAESASQEAYVYTSYETNGFITKMNDRNANEWYDGMTIHPYSGTVSGGSNAETFYDNAMKLAEDTGVGKVQGFVDRLPEGKVPVISEYGIFRNTEPQLRSQTHAIYIAKTLMEYVRLGSPYIQKHCLIDWYSSGGDSLGPTQQAVIQAVAQAGASTKTGEGEFDFFATPSAHVFQMLNAGFGDYIIDAEFDRVPEMENGVDLLSVLASKDDFGNIYLAIVNVDREMDKNITLDIEGLAGCEVSVQKLTSDTITEENTLSEPNNVTVTTDSFTATEDHTYTVEKHSIAVLKINTTGKADKNPLQDAIEEANGLTPALYEDFTGVQAAVTAGNAVMADADATAEEIADAVSAIEAAINALRSIYAEEDKPENVVTTENLNHVRTAAMTVSSVEVAQFGASNANDGDTTTRWSSASATDATNGQEWIKAEFAELTQIKHIKVKFHTRNTGIMPNNVSQFTIKYVDSDGNEQTAKANYALETSGNGYVTEASIVLDSAVVAKALKLCDFNISISGPYNSVGITELEAYSNEIESGAIVDLAGLVESLQGIQNGVIENGTFTLPEVPERFTIKLNGADFEQILGKDLTVVQPLTDKEIKVSYEVSDGTETKVTNDITYLVKGKNTQAEGKNAKPVIIPEIQEWYSESTEKLAANTLTKVTYDDASLAAIVDEFIADYKDFTGVTLTKEEGAAQAGAFNFSKTAPDTLLGEEGYTMNILADRINVASESVTGNMYGMQTILQMSKKDATGFAIGQMRDYPRFEVRGFMLDIARKPIGMEMIHEVARTMRYYKMNDFQLHLSDNYIWLEDYGQRETENESFKAYEAFRLECDVTNEAGESPTAKDYFITKDEMRTFIQSQRALGMNIVPEIDLPAHATSFTKIWPELMVQGAVKGERPLVDHFDITKQAAVEQIKAIFDDYTTGENPTFDSETVVHVGADEFEYNKTSYRNFFNTIVPHVKQTNPQVRIWGSLSTINDGVTEIIPEAIENVAMNIWNNGWANGQQMYNLGFKLINTLDGPNYMVPNGGMGRGSYGDLLNHTAVFNFDPNVYGGVTLPTSDDQILGSVYAIWNDNIDKRSSGLTDSDLYWRFFDALPLYAEKNWAATGREKGSASAVIELAQTMGTGPRTNPYYQEEADANGVHESYDFTNGMEDASANDRDLTIGTAKVEDGALTLKGGNSYVSTPIDKLGNGNELSFDITLTKIPEPGDILFETTPEYGTHDIRIMEDGKLGFTREIHNYYFDYELPVGKKVNIRIVAEQQDTTLYVNDVLVGEAIGKFIHNGMEKKTGITHSTFALPLERIGSKTNAIAAVIDNVVVREKEEVEEVDLYNKPAWTGTTDSETNYDAIEGLLSYAFDGKPGTIWHSNWQGVTDKLTGSNTFYAEIDFGQVYLINQFSFTPRTDKASGCVTTADLYVKESESDDWKLVGEDVTFTGDITKKTFYFDEQSVRYAKFVAKASNDGWVAVSEFDIANIPEPMMSVYVEAAEGGTATGATEVKKGTSVTVAATANTGYRFDGWYDSLGTKVSESAEYTFAAQKNTALVAKFALTNMGPNGAGAELVGYTLSLEGNIGVNFYLKLSDAVLADSENGAYMNFILNGSAQKVYVKDAELTTVNDTECYAFKCSVPVKDMNTEITAQIVLSDGSKGLKHSYTIEKYADYIRENEADYSDKVVELVEAMSDFGEFASAYFAEETVEEVPEEMLAVTAETLKDYQATLPVDNDDIYYGSSLSLKSETILRHYFTEEVEGSVKKGDLYYIERTGIPAHKLGEDITMTVTTTKGDMEITYSPLSYAYIALSRDDIDDNLTSLMRAMFLYYQAAQAYNEPNTNN